MEKVNSIEKINLSTGIINYMANLLNQQSYSFAMVSIVTKTQLGNDKSSNITTFLDEIAVDLHDISEKLADYMNNMDATTDEDCLVLDNIFKVLRDEHIEDTDTDNEMILIP